MGLRISPIASGLFQKRRERVQQEQTAQSQEELDALKRRLASLGGLDSGAALKIEQQTREKQAQRMQGALGGVEEQEQQFALQQEEAEKQRQFGREERLGQQEFVGKEALAARMFGREERIGGESFAGLQAEKQRTSEMERLGKQLFSAETMAKLQDETTRRGQTMQKELGLSQIDAQKYVADLDANNKLKLQGMVNDLELKKHVDNITLEKQKIQSQEDIEDAKLRFQKSTSAEDRKLAKAQLKNEYTMGLIANNASLYQLALDIAKSTGSSVGGALAEINQNVYGKLDNLMAVDDDGDLVINPKAFLSDTEGITGGGFFGLPKNFQFQL